MFRRCKFGEFDQVISVNLPFPCNNFLASDGALLLGGENSRSKINESFVKMVSFLLTSRDIKTSPFAALVC
jgi:hypothetical protein